MYDAIKDNAYLLIEALQKFGITNQKRKADEELNELALEIKRDLDGRMHNVEEEMADVYIMLAQMRLVYNQATIDGYIEAKIERLKRKIKNI